jgi:hypothetical protein
MDWISLNDGQTMMRHDVVTRHDVTLAWHRHVMTLRANAS